MQKIYEEKNVFDVDVDGSQDGSSKGTLESAPKHALMDRFINRRIDVYKSPFGVLLEGTP